MNSFERENNKQVNVQVAKIYSEENCWELDQ